MRSRAAQTRMLSELWLGLLVCVESSKRQKDYHLVPRAGSAIQGQHAVSTLLGLPVSFECLMSVTATPWQADSRIKKDKKPVSRDKFGSSQPTRFSLEWLTFPDMCSWQFGNHGVVEDAVRTSAKPQPVLPRNAFRCGQRGHGEQFWLRWHCTVAPQDMSSN